MLPVDILYVVHTLMQCEKHAPQSQLYSQRCAPILNSEWGLQQIKGKHVQ